MSERMPSGPSGMATLRDRLEERGFNFTGTVVLAFGAVLVLFAFTIPDWFRPGPGFFSDADGHSTFRDVGANLDAVRRAADAKGVTPYLSFGFAGPYFAWLGWVCFLVTLAVGVLAVSPIGQRNGLLRWLAIAVAFAAAAITLQSLDLITLEGSNKSPVQVPSWGEFVSHGGIGAWAAIAGFLVMLCASLAPRR